MAPPLLSLFPLYDALVYAYADPPDYALHIDMVLPDGENSPDRTLTHNRLLFSVLCQGSPAAKQRPQVLPFHVDGVWGAAVRWLSLPDTRKHILYVARRTPHPKDSPDPQPNPAIMRQLLLHAYYLVNAHPRELALDCLSRLRTDTHLRMQSGALRYEANVRTSGFRAYLSLLRNRFTPDDVACILAHLCLEQGVLVVTGPYSSVPTIAETVLALKGALGPLDYQLPVYPMISLAVAKTVPQRFEGIIGIPDALLKELKFPAGSSVAVINVHNRSVKGLDRFRTSAPRMFENLVKDLHNSGVEPYWMRAIGSYRLCIRNGKIDVPLLVDRAPEEVRPLLKKLVKTKMWAAYHDKCMTSYRAAPIGGDHDNAFDMRCYQEFIELPEKLLHKDDNNNKPDRVEEMKEKIKEKAGKWLSALTGNSANEKAAKERERLEDTTPMGFLFKKIHHAATKEVESKAEKPKPYVPKKKQDEDEEERRQKKQQQQQNDSAHQPLFAAFDDAFDEEDSNQADGEQDGGSVEGVHRSDSNNGFTHVRQVSNFSDDLFSFESTPTQPQLNGGDAFDVFFASPSQSVKTSQSMPVIAGKSKVAAQSPGPTPAPIPGSARKEPSSAASASATPSAKKPTKDEKNLLEFDNTADRSVEDILGFGGKPGEKEKGKSAVDLFF